MSQDAAPAVTVPTRLTAMQLASALGRGIEEIRLAMGEPGSEVLGDEYLDPETATRVARSFGVTLLVEPRDRALEILYQAETGGDPPDPSQLTGKVRHLILGVIEGKERLDQEIEAASEHWTIARMPIVDRSILRLGLFELHESPDTPTAVIVSEAVRLAQTYSTERSGAFVNGVLAALARRVRR